MIEKPVVTLAVLNVLEVLILTAMVAHLCRESWPLAIVVIALVLTSLGLWLTSVRSAYGDADE